MRVARDPRCPAHPAYEVHIQYRPPAYTAGPPVWVCSVCLRELGFASLSPVPHLRILSPHGRRRTPSGATESAIDWDYLYGREDPWDDPKEY